MSIFGRSIPLKTAVSLYESALGARTTVIFLYISLSLSEEGRVGVFDDAALAVAFDEAQCL